MRVCSIIAIHTAFLAVSLSSPPIAAANPPAAAKATKPVAAKKARPAKPASQAQSAASKPLTAEELGLGDISLSSIKAADAPAPAPAPTAAPVEPPPPVTAPVAEPPAPVLAVQARDKGVDRPRPTLRRLTLQINPAPVIGGRYGGNIDLVVARHHAIYASGWWQTFTSQTLRVLMPKAVDVSHGADAMPGGELGYRWYSGERGANGLFIGVSGVAMPLALPHARPDFRYDMESFLAYGGALDIGGQHITSAGFTFGLGAGAMGLAYASPSKSTAPGTPSITYATPHVLPRGLVTAGWSF